MWKVKYDNDTGADDDFFSEWWEVSNGVIQLTAYSEETANALCEHLNKTNFVI